MKKLMIPLTVILTMCLLFVGTSAKPVPVGDVNSDGNVTAADARLVLRASARLDVLSDDVFAHADADRDGKIAASDARLILRCAAGLEELGLIEDESETQPSLPDETATAEEESFSETETTTAPQEEESSGHEEQPIEPETVYLNEFMDDGDDGLELFVAGCEVKKQDGFVFSYKDEIYIHDGGQKDTGEDSVFSYLCDLRSSLLPEGVDGTDENYRLKITVILSHFHTDHMNTYIHDIIPSPYFDIEKVYLTKQSVFENTPLYEVCDPYYYSDGVVETKGRLKFLRMLSDHSPETEIIYVDFGETMQIKSKDNKLVFDLFAPSEDWGTAERAQHLLDIYYDGGKAGNTAEDYPKAVVNSNSMWLKVTYGERTMLFTGDVMKRAKHAYSPESENYAEEPFDVMLSYYAEKCGKDVFDVDIVKFPHHGQVRAEASKGVFEVFRPETVICTAMNFRETTVAKAQKFWDKYEGCYTLSDASGLFIYTDGKCVTVSKGLQTIEVYDADGKAVGVSGEILRSS